MANIGEFDRDIGPLTPARPSRKPERRQRHGVPDPRRERHRKNESDNNRRPRIDEYV